MARILLVEDNPLNAKLAAVILKSAGHSVVGASDARETHQVLSQERPDLILMDLGLPGLDGYALTREIRREPATREIPILAVTSFAMKGDELKALEVGCNGYLTKPIDRLKLLGEIQRLLGGAQPSSPGRAAPR
ncbi:MAG TPA: response regulator [Thermoplasmata archaeon]|nr:response regulator [Thermoplasmata archaeon]HEV2428341.1 response regulator [Thermoplasmata archaeon]